MDLHVHMTVWTKTIKTRWIARWWRETADAESTKKLHELLSRGVAENKGRRQPWATIARCCEEHKMAARRLGGARRVSLLVGFSSMHAVKLLTSLGEGHVSFSSLYCMCH